MVHGMSSCSVWTPEGDAGIGLLLALGSGEVPHPLIANTFVFCADGRPWRKGWSGGIERSIGCMIGQRSGIGAGLVWREESQPFADDAVDPQPRAGDHDDRHHGEH